jgi:putative aminophosphonate oxidoreductase
MSPPSEPDSRKMVRSLWLQEALAGESPAAPLREPVEADVCIVGGGFTGLWTAIHLKERDPAADVVLVERDVCGGGASGRNGGFVLSWWAKFCTLEQVCGTEEALRLAHASVAAVTEIGDFCRENGIDAHFRRDGWLWTATSRAQVGAWEPVLAALERLGESPFEQLDPAEVAARSGSPAHLAGVFERSAATVHPGLLARGLRRVAAERGVRIFEHSPMVGLDRTRPPRVRTAAGSVTAERVVLALNAWGANVKELRRILVVVASDVVATRPVPDLLRQLGWTNGLCIDDSRMLVNYYRTTIDGRIVFGKGGGALAFGGRVGSHFDGPTPRADEVAASLRQLYPAVADVPIDAAWLGPIDRSPLGLPFFVRVGGRDDILAGAGYSGNGVGPSFVGGRTLASLALGLDDEWARAGLTRLPEGSFPPEPLRYVGGLALKAAIRRRERAEDAGHRPGRVSTWIAGFAPPGLVPLKEREAADTAP